MQYCDAVYLQSGYGAKAGRTFHNYRAAVTHNHPEGIKGAQATALAVLDENRHSGRAKHEVGAKPAEPTCANSQGPNAKPSDSTVA